MPDIIERLRALSYARLTQPGPCKLDPYVEEDAIRVVKHLRFAVRVYAFAAGVLLVIVVASARLG